MGGLAAGHGLGLAPPGSGPLAHGRPGGWPASLGRRDSGTPRHTRSQNWTLGSQRDSRKLEEKAKSPPRAPPNHWSRNPVYYPGIIMRVKGACGTAVEWPLGRPRIAWGESVALMRRKAIKGLSRAFPGMPREGDLRAPKRLYGFLGLPTGSAPLGPTAALQGALDSPRWRGPVSRPSRRYK